MAVACAIVKSGSKDRIDKQIRDLADQVSSGKPIHFNKLSHQNKKACYERLPGYGGVVALSDTTKPTPKRLLDSITHYNDVLKEVVRRVLWQAALWEESPTIFIDRREGRFDLERFKAYMAQVDRDDDPYTDWTWFDPDKVFTAEPDEEPCLCLADGLAHAAFSALEPNDWSGSERTYLDMCWSRLWRPQPFKQPNKNWRKLLGNGLILLPEAETWDFIHEFPWLLEYHQLKD